MFLYHPFTPKFQNQGHYCSNTAVVLLTINKSYVVKYEGGELSEREVYMISGKNCHRIQHTFQLDGI